MMFESMDTLDDHIKRKSRRSSFEPQPLHIPAPPPDEQRKDDKLVDESKTGSYVIVIDIS